MIHHLYVPGHPLDLFVENMWFYNGYDPDHTKEKLLPDGAVEIIIDMHEGPKKLYNSNNFEYYTDYNRSWISGERKEFIVIEAGAHSSMMGIRFYPGGVWPFLRFPVSELTDQVVELDSFWGSEIHEVREQLLGAEDVSQKFSMLETFLFEKSKGDLEMNKVIAYAIQKIKHSSHCLTIRELAKEIGYSQKHLIDQFDKKVGVTPKVLARIFKFQNVIHMIENQKESGNLDWADIAFRCGYYDQSHFIKEFQAFSGINPTAYAEQQVEYINYIPID